VVEQCQSKLWAVQEESREASEKLQHELQRTRAEYEAHWRRVVEQAEEERDRAIQQGQELQAELSEQKALVELKEASYLEATTELRHEMQEGTAEQSAQHEAAMALQHEQQGLRYAAERASRRRDPEARG